MFINRQAELQLPQERYKADQAELFVLYGRRRLTYGLCACSGFTPQVEGEAARRKDLFLFDLPCVILEEVT